MESPPGPETIIDGRRYLYFGGTSYLGLAGHPEVIEAGCDALRRYGVHTATTRARLGNSAPVLEVERRAADFFAAADAFYFGSGYVGNFLMVAALAPNADVLLVDEAAHYCVEEASRFSGKRVERFRHRDPDDLARRVAGAQRPLVMADAVGPSSGTLAPVADYLEVLGRCEDGRLLLDDAHGFGVLGENGRGLLEECGLWNRGVNTGDGPLFVCGTLAKALGGFGGIIVGSSEFVHRVRTASHFFDGASAPAAAVAGSTAKALEIVVREPGLRARLRENTTRLRAGLRALGLEVPDGFTANFGVTMGSAAQMRAIHDELAARSIILPYVGAYTGIPPEGVLRFAVFANHTPEQIDHLLDQLRSLL